MFAASCVVSCWLEGKISTPSPLQKAECVEQNPVNGIRQRNTMVDAVRQVSKILLTKTAPYSGFPSIATQTGVGRVKCSQGRCNLLFEHQIDVLH